MFKRASRPFLFLVLASLLFQLAATAGPLGEPGVTAQYQLAVQVEKSASMVESFNISLGAAQSWEGVDGQWLRLEASKRSGTRFEVWLLCAAVPPSSLKDARNGVLRYVLKQGDAPATEYRHAVSRRAVLPGSGAWKYLLPRTAGSEQFADDFPEAVEFLGHKYRRVAQSSEDPASPPTEIKLHLLRPDVLTGVPSNRRQKDETRRYDGSDYEYIPLTTEDLQLMVVTGINCFPAEAAQIPLFEEAGVFYWNVGGADVLYPECLYQPLYIGPALFLDEPAVVTRDYTLRPKLREDAAFRKSITPQVALEALEKHYEEVISKGAPHRLLKGLSEREDVDAGAMEFVQPNIYSWETMVSSAAYQLLYHPETPGAIVFEPPGQLGMRRTIPAMNMSYGCEIPVTGRDHFIDIIIGFLRGAARVSGKEWGISIYGGVDRTDAPRFISRAYESGATRFFYWDNAMSACVPFGEVLDLTRHLNIQAREYPHRDLPQLLQAADTAILFPPGYNLGHVHMGRGILWGLSELNLERKNSSGVAYRTVMGNLFTEIERSLRNDNAFDLLWDLPKLDLQRQGYREVVRIREDGKVEIMAGGETQLLEGPRTPERPVGDAPQLDVVLPDQLDAAPCTIEVTARVREGDAPVYYAPTPDDQGVHHKRQVLWELYGPNEEDYSARGPEISSAPATSPAPGEFEARATLHIANPGRYRLRAATTDLSGKSTIVWKDLEVREGAP